MEIGDKEWRAKIKNVEREDTEWRVKIKNGDKR